MAAAVGCGGGPADQDAATAIARVKGGLESQRQAVEGLGTQLPGQAQKVATAAVATVVAAAPALNVPTPQGVPGMNEDQVRQIAQQALATALNVPASQVTVERVEAVQWSDASLGCRQAGQMYAQVITPGFRAVATVDGQRKEVHTDMAGRAIVCENPTQ